MSIGRRAGLGAAGAGGVLALTGFWQIDAIAASLAALGAGGGIAVRRGWIPRPHPSPARVRRAARPELPSLRELRGMHPHQRQQALGRAVAAPGAVLENPGPAAPAAAPRPPRTSWPVPVPRAVEPVSTAPVIPDHIPGHIAEQVQARATEKS